MKSKFKFLALVLVFCIWHGCSESDILPDAGTPVVSGYLYLGQPIDSLRVTLSVAYDGEGVLETLDDLQILIQGGGSSIELDPLGDGFYRNGDFNSIPNTEYTLSFEWDDKLIFAETYMPESVSAAISDTLVFREKVDVGGGGFTPGSLNADNIEVSWLNSTGDYYFVQVENIEEESELINERQLTRPLRLFRSEPEITDLHLINGRRDIQYFGRHRVIIYRLNPEYAALYQTIGNSSLSIQSPPTNVENGLGIFTGISTDTIYFEVQKI